MDERTTTERKQAVRPREYHREANRGPWRLALRRLHRRGYSDREIAERLCALSAEAIRSLEDRGSWNWRAVERCLEPHAAPLPWTQEQVKRHRWSMGLRANRRRWECGSLVAIRQSRRSMAQAEARLGRLLPRKNDREKVWEPGHELSLTEIRILLLLQTHGTLTRASIASCLGLQAGQNGLRSGKKHYLAHLVEAGLVEVAGLATDGHALVRKYRLAEGVLSDQPVHRLPTGVERTLDRLQGLN